MNKDIISDELLRKAVTRAIEIESAMYERKFALEKENSFSGKYAEQMKELLVELDETKEYSETKIADYSVKKMSTRVKILLIAAIVMLMGTTTVLAVEPLRETLYHFIEKVFADHTSVQFEEKDLLENETNITKENFEFRKVKYIPPNYKLEDEYFLDSTCDFSQIFVNGEGNVIAYDQCAIGSWDTNLITSDGKKAKQLEIDGNAVYWISDGEYFNSIIYTFEGYVYSVSGHNSVDELMEILKSVF